MNGLVAPAQAADALERLTRGVAQVIGSCVEAVDEAAVRVDDLLPPGSSCRQEVAEIRMATGQGNRFVWQLRELGDELARAGTECATDHRSGEEALAETVRRAEEKLTSLSGTSRAREANGGERSGDDPHCELEWVGHFAGGLAHRFNNLLTVIKGNNELLLMDIEESSPARELLDDIGRAVAVAGADALRMLGFGGRRLLQPRPVELVQHLRACCSEIRRKAPEAGLVWRLPEDPVQVCTDPAVLDDLLAELIDNAAHASAPGAAVTVSLELRSLQQECTVMGSQRLEPGAYAHLRVEDAGEGMDPGAVELALRPFHSTRPGRLGLGLPTVYGVMRQVNGAIAIQSSPGRGTAVELILPALQADTVEADRRVRPAFLPERATVLVVDDSEGVRRWLLKLLQRWGYAVLEARDGAEAVELAEAHAGDIDLMISDVVMPRLSGPEAFRRIGENRPEMRVLFVSGFGENTLSTHRLRERSAVMLKPVTPVELARRLGDLWGAPSTTDQAVPA
jgi:two-component system, cell cycle sensor histidine kinase and response regulator CckA